MKQTRISLLVLAFSCAAHGAFAQTTIIDGLKKNIWDKERTAILFISEKLKEGQIRGLEQHFGIYITSRYINEVCRKSKNPFYTGRQPA